MYCQPGEFWASCAKRVKDAIRNTDDPLVALDAATEWSARYRQLYDANPRSTWTSSDQDRFEDAADTLWDELIGQYLNPANLMLALAIKKYFKTLSAALEWMTKPQLLFFYALLAPSPIANDFTEAKADNEEIAALLREKLPPISDATLEERYPMLFERIYEEVKGVKPLP